MDEAVFRTSRNARKRSCKCIRQLASIACHHGDSVDSVYAAGVLLDSVQMQVDDRMVNLFPGMAVTVEINWLTSHHLVFAIAAGGTTKTLFGNADGRAGGFLGFVATLFPEGREFRGAERARITYEVAPDRAQWGTEIAGKVRAWAKALTGPTSLPYNRRSNSNSFSI